MRQYTFQAISRDNGAAFPIRATASCPKIARAHIVNYYGQNFEIAEAFMDVNPAHHILGEIDCTDADAPDLLAVLRQIERLSREADPRLVNVPAMLGDIAREAIARAA